MTETTRRRLRAHWQRCAMMHIARDVKRGRMLEAEARSSRLRPRPEARGQKLEAEAEAEAKILAWRPVWP